MLRPFFRSNLMTTCNSLRRGDCCGHFESSSDGYYCENGDFFFHKNCGDSSEYIEHPSHSTHTLQLQHRPWTEDNLLVPNVCDLCGKNIVTVHYRCDICDFDMDLYCAKYPPPEVLEISETHIITSSHFSRTGQSLYVMLDVGRLVLGFLTNVMPVT